MYMYIFGKGFSIHSFDFYFNLTQVLSVVLPLRYQLRVVTHFKILSQIVEFHSEK